MFRRNCVDDMCMSAGDLAGIDGLVDSLRESVEASSPLV